MTSISPVRDDEGPLRLKFADDAADLTAKPGAVAPYPGIRFTPRRAGTAERRTGKERRRAMQRRRGAWSAWLDTRSRHERRTRARRREDQPAAGNGRGGASSGATPVGIDRYA